MCKFTHTHTHITLVVLSSSENLVNILILSYLNKYSHAENKDVYKKKMCMANAAKFYIKIHIYRLWHTILFK